MKKYIALFILLNSLSACHPHHGGRLIVDSQGVNVQTGGVGGVKPPHCPPGHHKKGWC